MIKETPLRSNARASMLVQPNGQLKAYSGILKYSSDSEDINKGPSKEKVPKEDINERPSKGKLTPLGSSARTRPEVEDPFFDSPKKETKDKSSMDTFPGSTDEETSDTESTDKNITVGTTCKNILSYKDTIEKYVLVVKSASKRAIYKIPQPIIGVVLGLANLKTWDDIVQKIGNRPHGNSADKGKGKAKFDCMTWCLDMHFAVTSKRNHTPIYSSKATRSIRSHAIRRLGSLEVDYYPKQIRISERVGDVFERGTEKQ
ncbi:hypothetical protein Tco_1247149 [Tanacetum coccineum]